VKSHGKFQTGQADMVLSTWYGHAFCILRENLRDTALEKRRKAIFQHLFRKFWYSYRQRNSYDETFE